MTAFGRVLSEMANHPNSVHLEENSLKAVFQTVLSTDCDASEILNIRVCYFEKKKKSDCFHFVFAAWKNSSKPIYEICGTCSILHHFPRPAGV